MSYQYDLPDFKRYLNDLNKKNRVDGLIFWQNRIPLPIDLFNRMFRESDHFISLYFDHLLAAVLVLEGSAEKLASFGLTFADLPSSDVNKQLGQMTSFIHSSLQQDRRLQNVASELTVLMGVSDYQPKAARLIEALTHKGKKYPRLYCPPIVRETVSATFPSVFKDIGADNTDMIGNVIADHYDMYRAGFGDALANIFNKLLDFRLVCNGVSSGLQILTSIVCESDMTVIEERTRDGSLWEPELLEEHAVRLNPEHPFFTVLGSGSPSSLKAVTELLYSLSKFESHQFSTPQKKLIENMRQEISRELWIKYEK
ncbi:hypothetical protein [Neptunomonas sp.]|uniref:hypothetical protein n=1 Tax=Neptunomonas sp. TaxID=1971898 RepID=UPI0035689F82